MTGRHLSKAQAASKAGVQQKAASAMGDRPPAIHGPTHTQRAPQQVHR